MKKRKKSSKKKKRIKKKEQKESEIEEKILEEEIKNTAEEIGKGKDIEKREQIIEFLNPTEVKAPVLERIATQRPIEEPSIILPEQTEDEKRIDYAVSNEPKYSTGREIEQEERKYETTFIPPVLTRREISGGREDFFRPREDTWGEVKQINEIPQQFETMRTTGERLPFEAEEKKYKKVKF